MVESLRSAVMAVLLPLTGILGGTVFIMLVVHQLQVGGFASPGLCASGNAVMGFWCAPRLPHVWVRVFGTS